VRPDERDHLAGRDDEVGRREGDVAPEAARDTTRAQDHRFAAAGGAGGGSGTGVGPGRWSSTSTGTGPPSCQGSSAIRSEKNSQHARPAASSGSATKTPGRP